MNLIVESWKEFINLIKEVWKPMGLMTVVMSIGIVIISLIMPPQPTLISWIVLGVLLTITVGATLFTMVFYAKWEEGRRQKKTIGGNNG